MEKPIRFPNLSLEERMKYYENCYNTGHGGNHFAVVRLDGCGFSKITKKYFKNSKVKNMSEPFANIMRECLEAIMRQVPDAVYGYTHSDEINVLLSCVALPRGEHEIEEPSSNEMRITERWHNWRMQKVVSVMAGIATATFNKYMMQYTENTDWKDSYGWRVLNRPFEFNDLVVFDGRIVYSDCLTECVNNLLWRSHTNVRNAKMQWAQGYCSHKELYGLTADQAVDLVHAKLKDADANIYNVKEMFDSTSKTVYFYPLETGCWIIKNTFANPYAIGATSGEWKDPRYNVCKIDNLSFITYEGVSPKFNDIWSFIHPKIRKWSEAHDENMLLGACTNGN